MKDILRHSYQIETQKCGTSYTILYPRFTTADTHVLFIALSKIHLSFLPFLAATAAQLPSLTLTSILSFLPNMFDNPRRKEEKGKQTST